METATIPDWKEKHIIVAEDEESNFLVIKAMLKRTGVVIFRANNGKEVLDLLNSEKQIDLVLMDIKMPVMDGVESTRRIKEIRNLPVIAQTAYATQIEEMEFRKAGFDEYLTKPLRVQLVIETMKRFLEAG